jgi:hypothetical protein
MRLKQVWKIVGIAMLVAILGGAGVGAVALAQDTASATDVSFNFADKFREAIAGVLGITVDKYDEAIKTAQAKVVDDAVSEGWLTKGQAEMMAWRMNQAPAAGMPGMGKGRGMGGPGMMGGGDNLLSVAAKQLDMSLTDLLTELQGGKSIAGVAKDKGVDTQTIIDAVASQAKETLDAAVTGGRITQKQADYQLEQMNTRLADQLEQTGLDLRRGGHRGGGMGCPGMGGF